jgi:DNA polymerase III subunit beta
MKFEVLARDLQNELKKHTMVAAKRDRMEILNYVVISTEGDKISLTSTNLDVELNSTLNATVDKPGRIALPAYYVYESMKHIPKNALVEFQIYGDEMRIKSDALTTSSLCLDADDFPFMTQIVDETEFALNSKVLVNAIKACKNFMADSKDKLFNNVLVGCENQNLFLIASDRAVFSQFEIPINSPEFQQILIPEKTIKLLDKTLTSGDFNVKMKVSETKTEFSFLDTKITSKTVDMNYPRYRHITDLPITNKVTVETRKLLAWLSVLPIEKSIGRSNIVVENNKFSTYYGNAHTCLRCNYDKEPINIHVDIHRLIKVLKQLSDEYVCIKIQAKTSILIEGENFKYVIGLMR